MELHAARSARRLDLAGSRSVSLSSAAVAGIVGTRLLVGLVFILREGLDKVQHWTTPQQLIRFVMPGIANHSLPVFYRDFLSGVVASNAEVFRVLIMSSELLLGVCLIIGLGVRIGAVLQSVALLNYIAVKGFTSTGANSDIAFIILFFALFMVGAGRYYGVDGVLRRRIRWLSWL